MRVFILATADFDAEILTNKQQIAMRLKELVEVIYINSLGLRKPKLNIKDLSRIGRKLLKFLSKRQTGFSNLKVIQPLVLPWHKVGLLRLINSLGFSYQIRKEISRAPKEVNILWTFTPTTYGVEKYFDFTVYHSVDLLHTVQGIDSRQLLRDESKIVHNADAVIASSVGVKNHLLSLNSKSVTIWENVADIELFSSYWGDREDKILYFGNLTDVKVDISLLESVARLGIELFIAGPSGIDGTELSTSRLRQYSNVTLVDTLRPLELAELSGKAKIGLIPYYCNDHTYGVFPLKLYEYLAAGLTVVSTPLPSVMHLKKSRLVIAETENYSEKVKFELDNYQQPHKRNLLELQENSWDFRLQQIQQLLDSFQSKKNEQDLQ